jgi:hypothetical protein
VTGGSGAVAISPSIDASTTYYAQSRNTTTQCVSSSRLAVAVTVIPYGTRGQQPGACGCAAPLELCLAACNFCSATFTACSGITEVRYGNDGTTSTMDWSTANNVCSNAGMRVPTPSELQCLGNAGASSDALADLSIWGRSYWSANGSAASDQAYSCALVRAGSVPACSIERASTPLHVLCVK